MLKIDQFEIGNVKIINTIIPCLVEVNFYFDINGERNIPRFLVIIYFDYKINDDRKFIKSIKVEGPYDPAMNTGQDNDDFWLNVNDIIDSEINHRLFNVPQKERDVVIEEIFKKVEDAVKTLEIEL